MLGGGRQETEVRSPESGDRRGTTEDRGRNEGERISRIKEQRAK